VEWLGVREEENTVRVMTLPMMCVNPPATDLFGETMVEYTVDQARSPILRDEFVSMQSDVEPRVLVERSIMVEVNSGACESKTCSSPNSASV
jgi:hypothetical protein